MLYKARAAAYRDRSSDSQVATRIVLSVGRTSRRQPPANTPTRMERATCQRGSRRPHDQIGRTVIIAAVAGLTGVAITVFAASRCSCATNTGSGSAVVKSASLEPGYVDYGLRHPEMVRSQSIAPAYDDYGLRHPQTVQSAPIEPGYVDFGLRNVAAAGADPIATESDDYGLRHPAATRQRPSDGSPTTTASGTPPHSPPSRSAQDLHRRQAWGRPGPLIGGPDIATLTPPTGPTAPDGTPRPPQSEAYRLSVQFQLLGPLEVTRRWSAAARRPKQRLVLAHLLIRANEPFRATC